MKNFISKNLACLKWTQGLFGNGYRVALFSNLYLTVKGIAMSSLKPINNMFKVTLRAIKYKRTGRP